MRTGVRLVLGGLVAAFLLVGAGSGFCAGNRPALCIQGTMTTDEKPVAIVNDRIVGVGDEINGATVEEISDSSVRFTYQGESVSLLLGEECAGAASAGAAAAPVNHAYKPKAASTPAARPRSGSSQADAAAAIAVASSLMFFMLIFAAVAYVFGAFCLQRIAEKTGNEENKWWAWIPILNIFLMAEVAGKEWWWGFLMLIPYVNIIICVIIMMGICEARHKSPWLGLLTLVPLANLFLLAYLAFSSDEAAPTLVSSASVPASPSSQQQGSAPPPPQDPPMPPPPIYNP
ncbi:MAG: DUF5684 domain-containing protein [Deltaproteobacteria bacterium]